MLGSRATSGRASPHPTGQNTRETEPNTAATSTHTILFRIRSTAARSHDSSVRRATCSWPTHTFMLRIRSTAARSYDSSDRRDHVPWRRGHYVAIGHHITLGFPIPLNPHPLRHLHACCRSDAPTSLHSFPAVLTLSPKRWKADTVQECKWALGAAPCW